VTGNLRLDEGEIHSAVGDDKVGTGLTKFGTIIGDDVRIGIHTAILPGVKIGSQTFISSSTLVGKDVPEKSFVSMEGANMLVRPNKTAPPKPETRDAYRKAAKLHA
jgi:acetyltransferase-like isoleucine patch superfamily enzyme